MARKAKKTAPRGDRAPEQAADLQHRDAVILLRGRSLKEAVASLQYDCIFVAHFDCSDRCVGFTVPPDMRPWAQRVGFCTSVDEMQQHYERSKSWRGSLVLDFRSAAQAVADAERDGLPLDPEKVRRMIAEAGLPAADYLASLVAADNQQRVRQGSGRGRPKGGKPDAFAGYGAPSQLLPWLEPRQRHVWRAECMFQVWKRGLGAGSACEKVARWHHVSQGYLTTEVGALSHKK